MKGQVFLRCVLVLMQDVAMKVNKIERRYLSDITIWNV